MQFLPFADILVLTADEMELLLDTWEYQVGLFACCLRDKPGHWEQLVDTCFFIVATSATDALQASRQ